MVSFINSYFLDFSVVTYVLVFLLALALPKRRWFWLRAGICFVTYYVICRIFPGEMFWLRQTIIPGIDMTLGFDIMFLFVLICIPICFRCSWQSVFFVGIIGWMFQHEVDYLGRIFLLLTGLKRGDVWTMLFKISTIAGVICLEFFVLQKRLKGGDMQIRRVFFILIGFASLLVADWSGQTWSCFFDMSKTGSKYVFYFFTIFACSLLVVFYFGMLEESNIAKDNREMKIILAKQNEAQRAAKANYEAVHMLIHDLRAQINSIRMSQQPISEAELAEFDKRLDAFGSVGETGNHMLDVLLSEKSLLFAKHHIRLSAMADGNLISFIAPEDIYALFGNALDNAFEAELKEDKSSRLCSFQITKKGNFVGCIIRNPITNPPKIVGDLLPVSTKKGGSHGYGLRSIRATAEKYGGTMVLESGNHEFIVHILLPLQKEK